jgi:hypothetical protein
MPSTKTEGSPRTSKTDASKQVQDQTPSESEALTQTLQVTKEKKMPSPEKAKKKVATSEKIGEATIIFFKNRTYDVKVKGAVTQGLIQRCRRALYKAARRNQLDLRRLRGEEKAKKMEDPKPGLA